MTRKYGGTGLGLILAREFARLLGGDVLIVNSELGRGTTIQCTIAVSEVEGYSQPLQALGRETTAWKDLKGLSILLVDDSEDNRLLFGHYLKDAGATVDFAENGRSGVAKASSQHYDLILMDIQMPILGGNMATLELRRGGFRQPIIALTAYALKDERDRAFREGFTDYLTKSLSQNTLLACIRRHV